MCEALRFDERLFVSVHVDEDVGVSRLATEVFQSVKLTGLNTVFAKRRSGLKSRSTSPPTRSGYLRPNVRYTVPRCSGYGSVENPVQTTATALAAGRAGMRRLARLDLPLAHEAMAVARRFSPNLPICLNHISSYLWLQITKRSQNCVSSVIAVYSPDFLRALLGLSLHML